MDYQRYYFYSRWPYLPHNASHTSWRIKMKPWLLQGRYANTQEAYEKIFNIISHRGNANLNHSKRFPYMHSVLILVAQSCPKLFVNPWTAACQASLFITNSWSSLKLMSIESLMPSNHLILCRPLFFLPSIFPSLRVISNESVFHIRWAKYWRFSFNISPSNEYSGLISFRIDLFDLLAVQRTLKSLLQNHGSKALILRSSAFFMVQLSHPYISSV